jgi:hypothetical protein
MDTKPHPILFRSSQIHDSIVRLAEVFKEDREAVMLLILDIKEALATIEKHLHL